MFKRAFYPFLFAAYPLLFLWSENAVTVSIKQVALPLLISLVAVAVVWTLAGKYFRDSGKGALFASAVTVLFFAFGHLFSAIYLALFQTEFGSRNVSTLESDLSLALLCSFLLLLVFLHRLLRKQRKQPAVSMLFFNSASVILILLSLLSALVKIGPLEEKENPTELSAKVEPPTGYFPDIYHVVLDGYGRNDMLAKYFAWDNSEFLQFLRAEGFSVPERTEANYFWTMLSLASTLNMEYLDDLKGQNQRRELREVYRRLRNNRLTQTLRGLGYEIVHFQSSWGATLHNRYADRQVGCDSSVWQDEFLRLVAETSLLRLLHGRWAQDLAECHLKQVENLKKETVLPGPKYVFAHFIPPHHPYLFAKDGKIKKHVTLADQFDFQNALWGEKDSYIEQLQFVNTEIKELVAAIKQQSTRPPIIVLQSDHGPQLLEGNVAERREARFANFAAFYLPGAGNIIPEDVSAVNFFRYILNYYFKQSLSPLRSRRIYSGYHSPFAFEDAR